MLGATPAAGRKRPVSVGSTLGGGGAGSGPGDLGTTLRSLRIRLARSPVVRMVGFVLVVATLSYLVLAVLRPGRHGHGRRRAQGAAGAVTGTLDPLLPVLTGASASGDNNVPRGDTGGAQPDGAGKADGAAGAPWQRRDVDLLAVAGGAAGAAVETGGSRNGANPYDGPDGAERLRALAQEEAERDAARAMRNEQQQPAAAVVVATVSPPAATVPKAKPVPDLMPALATPFDKLPAPMQCSGTTDPLHFWFAQPQEANGRTCENILRRVSDVRVIPPAGHRSLMSLLEEYHKTRARGLTCHAFGTILRDPVTRVLAEYEAGLKRVIEPTTASGAPSFDCNHSNCEDLELKLRMANGTMSLLEYVLHKHSSKSPNNRQTYTIGVAPGLELNDPVLTSDEFGQTVLESAKEALRRMHFVGIAEEVEKSFLMLNKVLRVPFDKFDEITTIVRTTITPTAAEVELIRQHNRLDQELYSFALQIFMARYKDLREHDTNAPWSYECAATATCGAPINEAIYKESPKHAYLNVKAKPWHTLCARPCARVEGLVEPPMQPSRLPSLQAATLAPPKAAQVAQVAVQTQAAQVGAQIQAAQPAAVQTQAATVAQTQTQAAVAQTQTQAPVAQAAVVQTQAAVTQTVQMQAAQTQVAAQTQAAPTRQTVAAAASEVVRRVMTAEELAEHMANEY